MYFPACLSLLNMRSCLVLVLFVFQLPVAHAQSSHAGKWFQVEVIIFTQTSPGGSDPSRLPQVEVLNQPAGVQFLRATENALSNGQGGRADPASDPFVLLSSGDRALNEMARRIDGNGSYRVLYHQAWRQPVLLRRDAQPIYIRGGSVIQDTPELEGLLTLSVDVYLATEADLRLSEPGDVNLPPPPGDPLAVNSDWHQQAARAESGIRELDPAGAFTGGRNMQRFSTIALQEKRGRMRSTELHYFDHPRLGMVLRFDRYQPPPGTP